MDISSSQFAQVYEMLGIDPNNLGCIMLDVDPIVVSDLIQQEDVFVADDEHDHMAVWPAEATPHCTLLYGLLRPGPELKSHVDAVLSGWEPTDQTIHSVSFFYSNKDGVDYITIVALLEETPNLLEANARLRLLPHIDTFPAYKPHVSLAFVKASSDWTRYVTLLNERLAGTTVRARGINYGD